MRARKTYPHDRFLAATALKLFPSRIHPNHLTLFRLAATPVVLLFLHLDWYGWGLFAFLLVSATDALDGSMARTRGRVTEWGMLWDPVADKVLVASTAAILILDHLPPLFALLIFLTEAVFIGAGWLRKRKGIIVSANVWGKFKMLLQVLGITLFILSLIAGSTAAAFASYTAFIIATALALVSLYRHGI